MAETLATKLTRKDSVRLFLYGYYSRPGWQWVRILAAPVLIVLGAILLPFGLRATTIYGGICIGYGCYYAVRPLLLLIPRLKGMVDLAATYEVIPGEGVRFSDGSAETNIPLKAIRKVRLGTRYLTIEVKTKRKYFFHIPLRCLVGGNAEEFRDALQERTRG